MKAIVIYHNKDADGFCSGAICHQGLTRRGYDVDLVGYDYKDGPFDISRSKYDLVLFTDVTFPIAKTMQLEQEFGSDLIILDHHVSFHEMHMEHMLDGKHLYFYDPDESAAEIAWRYFNSEPIPVFVYGVGVWDLHRKEDLKHGYSFPDYTYLHNAVQVGLGDICEDDNLQKWEEFLKATRGDIDSLICEGEIIEEVYKSQGVFMTNACSAISIDGLYFNTFNGLPNKHVYINNPYPFLFWYYDGATDKFVCSLRQNESHRSVSNILAVAKKFHGGGHANACGFVLEPEEFFKVVLGK